MAQQNDAPGNPAPVTPSGIEIPRVLLAEDAGPDKAEMPGEFPYTRGIFADGFRGRLWTIRQYSGFGSAEETNQRYRFLLEQGQTGLSVALDLPTQCGYDPDDPMAEAEIGKVGVSIATLADAEILFDGLDLSKVSTSFTINGTAPIIYAMYLAAADKRGVARETLTGTIQNDILKEYVARGTWIFPVKPSMRMIADSILYSNEQTPRFNPISIAGAHMRDAGATAVEEMGYTLANGLAYVDELIGRDADINEVAKRLSFFFYVHMDLFEEVAKFRAGRRVWAKLLSERYGVSDPKALMFRFGVVCGGSSLTASQPYNNIVRVGIENLAAVLGGAQSIFTCAYDEAFQIPTETSAELALRTQQIVAFESGVSKTVDPLGGSHYVEWLTDQTEAGVMAVIEKVEAYGGSVKAIEEGYLQSQIAQRALTRKKDLDSQKTPLVGVNCFTRDDGGQDFGEVFKVDPETAKNVLKRFSQIKASRNDAAVKTALEGLRQAALGDENVMPHLVACCHAYASVGEMVATLKAEWGEFNEPVIF